MNSDEEIKEAIEHRDIILDLRALLSSKSGRNFIKYLFKHLEVAELPELGSEGNLLFERLGTLRAGHAIFKLASEANFEVAGKLLAEIEKEKYERLYREQHGDTEDGEYEPGEHGVSY